MYLPEATSSSRWKVAVASRMAPMNSGGGRWSSGRVALRSMLSKSPLKYSFISRVSFRPLLAMPCTFSVKKKTFFMTRACSGSRMTE